MRKPFNFRLSESGHQWVQGLAEKHEVKQADVFRAAMSVATENQKAVEEKIKQMKEQP